MKDEYSSLIQRFRIAWNSCRSFLGEQGKEVVSLFAGSHGRNKTPPFTNFENGLTILWLKVH